MKIVLLNVFYGNSFYADQLLMQGLRDNLRKHGHKVDMLEIPFVFSKSGEMFDQLLAYTLLHWDDVDRIIALKFPAYFFKHPDLRIWVAGLPSEIYSETVKNSEPSQEIVQRISELNSLELRKHGKIFSASKTIADQLQKCNQVASEVIHPPLLNPESYYCSEYGNFIFAPNQLANFSRQMLAVESMKYVTSGVKLVLEVSDASENTLQAIRESILRNEVASKVDLISHNINKSERTKFFNTAVGVLSLDDKVTHSYIPFEAFASEKPVITCMDSKVSREFVEDGITGDVVEPEPASLAAAMDRLYLDRTRTKRLGHEGLEFFKIKEQVWGSVVERIMS